MDSIERIKKNARASWWEDGLTEIISGIGVILIGLYGLFSKMAGGSVSRYADILFIVVLLAIIFAVRYLIIWAKRNFVWPHTGYAMPKQNSERVFLWSIVAIALLLFLILLTFYKPELYSFLLSLAVTLFVAGVYASIAIYSQLKRFWLYSAVGLLTGLFLTFTNPDPEMVIFVLLLATGIVSTIGGLIQFGRFRKEVAHGHISEDN